MAWIGYAVWVDSRQVEVVRHDLRASASQQSFDWRLVQLSDLHLGFFGLHEDGIARKVRELHADVIVLSGDAIESTEVLPQLLSFIRALGNIPVLLVPGNWEHWG
jgi:predicted MPP superfamily phosphohydrolase